MQWPPSRGVRKKTKKKSHMAIEEELPVVFLVVLGSLVYGWWGQ